HEMTHIIFREFVGTKIALPLWIDEGVASSQEKSHLQGRLQFARNLIEQGKYINFDKFFQIYRIVDVQPKVFYSQSASIIVFLLDRYGKERFVEFSRKLRDGTPWDKALLGVYRFKDFGQMEDAWKDFILRNF
ncbi:MAG: peptidase MA family metallohydrolase, partial [Candidatus Omnitrophica bacterium]|nr:peptidase MA family metallohydrolase [Candidatus Omnitrophota bacterium]